MFVPLKNVFSFEFKVLDRNRTHFVIFFILNYNLFTLGKDFSFAIHIHMATAQYNPAQL